MEYFASVYGRPRKRNLWFIYFGSKQYKIKVLGNLSEGELRGPSPTCICMGLLGHREGACAVSPASPLCDANLEPKPNIPCTPLFRGEPVCYVCMAALAPQGASLSWSSQYPPDRLSLCGFKSAGSYLGDFLSINGEVIAGVDET